MSWFIKKIYSFFCIPTGNYSSEYDDSGNFFSSPDGEHHTHKIGDTSYFGTDGVYYKTS